MSTRNGTVKAIGMPGDKHSSAEKKSSIHGKMGHRSNKSRDFQSNAMKTNIMATGNQIVGGNLKKLPLTTRNA